jgi:aryl-alcohol dehydrogenase-like predicted oxidoreductase
MMASLLTLGTAQLGMRYGVAGNRHEPTELHAANMLHAAYELGITSFDTAPCYGGAEARIGRFLRGQGLHAEVTLCTKLPSLAGADPAHVEQYVDDAITSSLRRLRTDMIDIYLLHDAADLVRHGRALVDALARQRAKGRTRTVGVSAYRPDELTWVEAYPELGVVQHPFNLLDRRLLGDGCLPRLAASGTRLQVRSVLLQGLLAMPLETIPSAVAGARDAVRTLTAVLARFGLNAAEAAVPFALSANPGSVVVGAETTAQLEAFVTSTATRLPDELLDALASELAEVPANVIDPRTWRVAASDLPRRRGG